MSTHRISLIVNGKSYAVDVPARMTLADALRDELDLVGTHLGCEHGICGTCTVMIDGAAARSCTVLAVSVDRCEIRTVEGLAQDGKLTPTQEAFQDHHGLQCGFCTTGYLMSLESLLSLDEPPSREVLSDTLAGVTCRCTGYVGVVEAAEAAVVARFGALGT